MTYSSIEQKFRIVTLDGTFEEFFPCDLAEVEQWARELSPDPGYLISVEPLSIVSIPRRLLAEATHDLL